MSKKLVCIGGGEIPRYKNGVFLPYETKEIDEEIVKLSNKEHPKFLFISIASSHPEEYFEEIKKVYEELGCIVKHLVIKAYDSGIVCSGLSAGSYCWFKYNYDLIEGMNVINAVNCVHYDQKNEMSKNKFYNVVKEKNIIGYAIDNQVALEFIDDDIKVIKSNPLRNTYKITCNGEKIDEKII